MGKILILTRGNLPRWEENLALKLKAEVSMCSLMKRPWYFVLGSFAEEVQFYRKLPQAPYWKERIYHDYPFPKWLGYITPLKYLKRLYKPPKQVYDYFKKENPDLVICSTLMLMPIYSDYDLALVARELHIPVIGVVPTWDSLCTKTKFQVKPDLVFCWNSFHREQLEKYHGISPSIIREVGPYTHESWLELHSPTRKDKFLEKYGLKDKPIITFISSSPATVGDETQAIETLRDHFKDYQLIVRPHPQRAGQYFSLKGVWVIPGTAENTQESRTLQTAFDCYWYSEAVYSINSSGMFDAALIGRPICSVKTQLPDIREGALHVKPLIPYLDGHGTKKIYEWLNVKNELPTEIIAKTIHRFGDSYRSVL